MEPESAQEKPPGRKPDIKKYKVSKIQQWQCLLIDGTPYRILNKPETTQNEKTTYSLECLNLETEEKLIKQLDGSTEFWQPCEPQYLLQILGQKDQQRFLFLVMPEAGARKNLQFPPPGEDAQFCKQIHDDFYEGIESLLYIVNIKGKERIGGFKYQQ